MDDSRVDWLHLKLLASESAELKLRHLRRHLRLGDHVSGRDVLVAWLRSLPPSVEPVLCAGRLISLDARTAWECIGDAFSDRLQGLIDGWNEQLAVKAAHQLYEAVGAAPPELERLCRHAESLKPASSSVATVGAAAPVAVAGTCVGVTPMVEDDDYSEGALVCAAPVAAFGTLLTVPREEMFFRGSVTQHCALGAAIAADPQLRAALEDEEALLVVCLLYERFCVGEARSHYGPLLRRCPSHYPTVPAFWDWGALAELDGLDVLDETVAKEAQLADFQKQIAALLPALHGALPSDSGVSFDTFAGAYGAEELRWARATFDSRAFNVRVDGEDVLALIPLADMINHANRTDVLVRRVEPDGGPFVMQVGAALTAEAGDVGRELWMSYGPLQNWELLLHYGFVLPGNEHDKLPFPLALPSETDTEAVDEWDRRRSALVAAHGLLTGGRCWVGYTGVPCEALRALLRVHLAQASEFDAMEAAGPFRAVGLDTERAIIQTIADTVNGVLGLFSTSLEEDRATLAELREGGSDEDKDGECAGPHEFVNYALCVQLRAGLKEIAARCLDWCGQAMSQL